MSPAEKSKERYNLGCAINNCAITNCKKTKIDKIPTFDYFIQDDKLSILGTIEIKEKMPDRLLINGHFYSLDGRQRWNDPK